MNLHLHGVSSTGINACPVVVGIHEHGIVLIVVLTVGRAIAVYKQFCWRQLEELHRKLLLPNEHLLASPHMIFVETPNNSELLYIQLGGGIVVMIFMTTEHPSNPQVSLAIMIFMMQLIASEQTHKQSVQRWVYNWSRKVQKAIPVLSFAQ